WFSRNVKRRHVNSRTYPHLDGGRNAEPGHRFAALRKRKRSDPSKRIPRRSGIDRIMGGRRLRSSARCKNRQVSTTDSAAWFARRIGRSEEHRGSDRGSAFKAVRLYHAWTIGGHWPSHWSSDGVRDEVFRFCGVVVLAIGISHEASWHGEEASRYGGLDAGSFVR